MFNFIRNMKPVTYVRTMLVMIGIQYSGATALAAMGETTPALFLLLTATVCLINLTKILR